MKNTPEKINYTTCKLTTAFEILLPEASTSLSVLSWESLYISHSLALDTEKSSITLFQTQSTMICTQQPALDWEQSDLRWTTSAVQNTEYKPPPPKKNVSLSLLLLCLMVFLSPVTQSCSLYWLFLSSLSSSHHSFPARAPGDRHAPTLYLLSSSLLSSTCWSYLYTQLLRHLSPSSLSNSVLLIEQRCQSILNKNTN